MIGWFLLLSSWFLSKVMVLNSFSNSAICLLQCVWSFFPCYTNKIIHENQLPQFIWILHTWYLEVNPESVDPTELEEWERVICNLKVLIVEVKLGKCLPKLITPGSLEAWPFGVENLSPLGKLIAELPSRCFGLYAVGGGPHTNKSEKWGGLRQNKVKTFEYFIHEFIYFPQHVHVINTIIQSTHPQLFRNDQLWQMPCLSR